MQRVKQRLPEWREVRDTDFLSAWGFDSQKEQEHVDDDRHCDGPGKTPDELVLHRQPAAA